MGYLETVFIEEDSFDDAQHSGVLGMKWGVRNAETQARYAREKGFGGKLTKKLNKRKEAIKKTLDEKRKKASEERKKKSEEKAAYKDKVKKSGADSKRQYEEMRKTALRSHDPKVIAQNMAALSDDELRNKITRVKLEQELRSLIPKTRAQKIADTLADEIPRQALQIGRQYLTQAMKPKEEPKDNSKKDNKSDNPKKTPVKLPKKKPSAKQYPDYNVKTNPELVRIANLPPTLYDTDNRKK